MFGDQPIMLCQTAIAELFKVSQPTVSEWIRVLRTLEVLKLAEPAIELQSGEVLFYRVNPSNRHFFRLAVIGTILQNRGRWIHPASNDTKAYARFSSSNPIHFAFRGVADAGATPARNQPAGLPAPGWWWQGRLISSRRRAQRQQHREKRNEWDLKLLKRA